MSKIASPQAAKFARSRARSPRSGSQGFASVIAIGIEGEEQLPGMQTQGFNAIRVSAVVVSAILLGGSFQLNAFDTPGWTFDGITEVNHNTTSKVFVDGILAILVVILMVSAPIPYILLLIGPLVLQISGQRALAISALLLMVLAAAYFRLVSWSAWLANPALVCSWCLYLSSRYRAAAISSAVSGILAVSFLFVGKIPYGPKDYDVYVLKYDDGYWMWLGSIAVMTICCNVDYWLIARPKLQFLRESGDGGS